jgi:hypothetical protein
LALVLSVCGLSLAACGVTSSEQAYTQPLIKQVGAGSVALGSLVTTLEADVKAEASGMFSDPATQQATTHLVEGQLDKLSQSDLVRMASANHAAATQVGGVLAKLAQQAASLSGAAVNAGSHPNLPGGSTAFIADWDQYLMTTANYLRNIRKALAGVSPVYNEFQSLLRAAYDTAKLHSTVQFDKVRRAVFTDIGPRYAPMKNALQTGARAGTAVEHRLISFVNSNQEAEAIVTKVNQEYPSGFLAQEFKS